MKKLFMTLFAAATLLAVGCAKNDDATSDEASMNMMAGVWVLDEMKFNDQVINPDDYVNYVDEDYQQDYINFIAEYQNITFTFYANGDGEVLGEPFTYQIREGGQMAITRDGVTIITPNDTISLDDYELPYTVLSLTENEALFSGFLVPMPHFHFYGGTVTFHLTKVGEAPEPPAPEPPINDTIK